jgi:leader peptidase (prepilin peptidase)/N-methyltransferase
MIELSQTPTPTLYLLAVLFGSILGSFLNVLIYRLPRMLESNSAAIGKQAFNLLQPRSFCPYCNRQLTLRDNIPLLSFILLSGRCAHCQHKIPVQYPVIELTSALLACIALNQFGISATGLSALVFLLGLLALSVIDLNTMTLPDELTLSLLWLGLAVNLFDIFATLEESVLGAMIGYLCLWLVYQLHRLLTQREGMGYGDFKLLAMIAAWLGWGMLLPTILIASVSASVIGIALLLFGKLKRNSAMPFGPFLALGACICLLWQDQLTDYFFNY